MRECGSGGVYTRTWGMKSFGLLFLRALPCPMPHSEVGYCQADKAAGDAWGQDWCVPCCRRLAHAVGKVRIEVLRKRWRYAKDRHFAP